MASLDAPRSKEQRSLFGEILDWMLAPLLLLWPMSVLVTWVVAQNIANKPFDRELGGMARTLAQQITVQPGARGHPAAHFHLPPGAAELLRTDGSDEIYYQVLGLRGEFLDGDSTIPVPLEADDGTVGEVRFRDDMVNNTAVRVAYLWVLVDGATPPAGAAAAVPTGPLVQVAETLGKRSRLATEIIKGVILPQFVILPLAVLLVWFALSRGIAPLNALQGRIRRRESHDLSPIDERDVPEEVSPLVRSINDLLARLDKSMGAQKHFLADAARIRRADEQLQKAARRLCDGVVARPRGGRAVGAEAADRAVDEARVQRAQPRLAGAELVGDARAEVLDVDVGLGDEFVEQRQVGGLAGVERDALLVAVVGLVVRAVEAAAEGTERVAGRLLDLHDVGAEVGEQHRCRRAGDEGAVLEHAHAGENPGHRVSPRGAA